MSDPLGLSLGLVPLNISWTLQCEEGLASIITAQMF